MASTFQLRTFSINTKQVRSKDASSKPSRKKAAQVQMLRSDEIAYEVSGDPNVSTALVDAFQHGDYRTRQIAERALKHVDRLPNFSGVFPNAG